MWGTYEGRRFVRGGVVPHGRLAVLRQIDQSVLIVTTGGDHIVPRTNTGPLLDYFPRKNW